MKTIIEKKNVDLIVFYLCDMKCCMATVKDNINKIDQDAKTVYWIILEKLSIVLCLIIVFAGALALSLPWWAVGAILGFSLGPIVYGHYYFIYIRPMIKRRED